jgi:hypothetical protein
VSSGDVSPDDLVGTHIPGRRHWEDVGARASLRSGRRVTPPYRSCRLPERPREEENVNQRSEPAPAVLSVVETVASPHLHLVRDHPAELTLCGRDAQVSTVVRRTDVACCSVCMRDALDEGHLVAVTAANAFVNLRRLAVAGREDAS